MCIRGNEWHAATQKNVSLCFLGVVVEWSDKASWESEHTIDWYDAESVKQYRYVPFSITAKSMVSVLIRPVARYRSSSSYHHETI